MYRPLTYFFAASALCAAALVVPAPLPAGGVAAVPAPPAERETKVSAPPARPDPGAAQEISLAREDHWLVIKAPHIPGREIRINYLEAYCRAGSTGADWVKHTTVGHSTELLAAPAGGREIKLRCHVKDGLTVEHTIRAVEDGVTFELTVNNPTDHANEAEWAQPCIRLGNFAGGEKEEGTGPDIKLSRAFIFLNGKLTTMPTLPWATQARYTPGQVWCPREVPRTDVNPRPLSTLVPDNGLIGCFSKDGKWLFAVCFEPTQELFQGVAQCLHNDFRIGQVPPGQSKKIRGRIWILPADGPLLVSRHREWLKEK